MLLNCAGRFAASVAGRFFGVGGQFCGGGGAALSSYTARLAFCFAIDHQHQRHQAAAVAAAVAAEAAAPTAENNDLHGLR